MSSSHTHTHTHSFPHQERRDLVAEMEERRRHEKEIMRASFPAGKAVSLQKFYMVDIQSLCEIPERDQTTYLPCELAAIEFSLHSGVHKSLHKFIDPGKPEPNLVPRPDSLGMRLARTFLSISMGTQD